MQVQANPSLRVLRSVSALAPGVRLVTRIRHTSDEPRTLSSGDSSVSRSHSVAPFRWPT